MAGRIEVHVHVKLQTMCPVSDTLHHSMTIRMTPEQLGVLNLPGGCLDDARIHFHTGLKIRVTHSGNFDVSLDSDAGESSSGNECPCITDESEVPTVPNGEEEDEHDHGSHSGPEGASDESDL